MQVLTTITSKFQVYIPQDIRKKVGLKKHGKALIETRGDEIIIKPVESKILRLGGAFKVKKPIPAEKIRDHINYSFGKR